MMALFRRERLDRELAEELEAHLQMQIAENIGRGMTPAEARRAALAKLGGITQAEQQYRDERGVPVLEQLLRDIRLGVRALRGTPGLTAAAILTLGLGLGATTAIFGFVNAALFRPLPVERPDELVTLESRGGRPTFSYPNYRDIRDRNTVLSGLVALRLAPMSLSGGQLTPTRIWGFLATGNYFDVLGVRAAIGRTFTQADDTAPGAHPVVVLSDGFWRRAFGGDATIVGQHVILNGRAFSVLGVTPPAFRGTEFFYTPDVWVPMMMQERIEPGNPWLEHRTTHNVFVFGRLPPGISRGAAEASLGAVAAQLGREHPAINEGMRISLSPVGLVGNVLRGPVIGFSGALLALAALVLLLACMNLTGLLLARATDRQRHTAICVALGAGRLTLVRQALVESALFNAAAAAAALLLTSWAGALLAGWRLPIDLPLSAGFGVDRRVVLFATGLAAVSTLLVGLVPAITESRADVIATLKDGAPRLKSGWYVRDAVVAIQIALSTVLLLGSLLVVRSLQGAAGVDVGFNPRGAVAVRVDLGLQGYDAARGAQFQHRVRERLLATPGILSASTSNSLPLSVDQSTHGVYIQGRPDPPASEVPFANYYQVAPGFFDTLGTRLVAGRDFDARDTARSPRVAIVNETFVRRLLDGRPAMGRRFRTGRSGGWTEIVGVAQDGKYQTLGEEPKSVVFHPLTQRYNATTTILARASVSETDALKLVRQTVREIDPSLSMFEDGPLRELLALPLLPLRVAAVTLTAFGVVALALVSIGLWALVSYGVARRTREICIRRAVGAPAAHIARLVLLRTAVAWIAGVTLGGALALAGMPLLSQILVATDPQAPSTFVFAALILAAVAACATWVPTRRALLTDPAMLLRRE
jgi:predicted permease